MAVEVRSYARLRCAGVTSAIFLPGIAGSHVLVDVWAMEAAPVAASSGPSIIILPVCVFVSNIVSLIPPSACLAPSFTHPVEDVA